MNMLTDALPCIMQWSMSKHGFPEPSTEHVVKDHCLRKRMELMQTILKLWILYDWNEFKKLASLNEHAAVHYKNRVRCSTGIKKDAIKIE